MSASRTLAIDASNIRDGGGITHLSRLLGSANPGEYGIGRVFIWGRAATLAELPDRPWLSKVHVPLLERSLPLRVFWQQLLLPGEVTKAGCVALFSPGGTIPAMCPVPVVMLSQNLLPFSPEALKSYSLFSRVRLKMALLKQAQAASARNCDGIIFLSDYARSTVFSAANAPRTLKTAVIPHGIEERFFYAPRPQSRPENFTSERPARLLYVSAIDGYKHQIEVAAAVAALRRKGLSVAMDFVGFPRSAYLGAFIDELKRLDPDGKFLRWRGEVPFSSLHEVYRGADIFIFASSCENLPNILIEAMASGLPIACSDREPMPAVLQDGGCYFKPVDPVSIASALEQLMNSPETRSTLAARAYELAKPYSWKKCADDTFAFLSRVSAS